MSRTKIYKDMLVNDIGRDMYGLIEKLYPVCRSITGDGVRETLKKVSKIIPIDIHEVPTGTEVFDWEVPREWNIRNAYIKNESGELIVDFSKCNLHVVSYSTPVHKKISLAELKEHLFTLPEHPDWIPYRTSYYSETWGFCISHNQLMGLQEGVYEVFVDSTLEEGHLSYGEYVLPGEIDSEILLSTHVCHPSLANDNLSGIALLAYLARQLSQEKRKYTYRFLFIPGTIGSITWLALNEDRISKIKYGLVVACVGDDGGPTYKRSRQGDTEIDLVVQHVLKHSGKNANIINFSPYGYDERQYCSPGINIPVGLFERSKYGEFPEYHTSADNLEFISPENLSESFQMVSQILSILDENGKYNNLYPKCEPQLGKRGLYDAIGGDKDRARKQMALLWVLNQSDGNQSLLEISERADIPFDIVQNAAMLLEKQGLIKPSSNA